MAGLAPDALICPLPAIREARKNRMISHRYAEQSIKNNKKQ